MTAITLTIQAPSASVLIDVTDAPAGAVTITRTDANGSRPVRLRDGQVPTAGALSIVDAEPALTGAVRYDVLDTSAVVTTATLAGLGLSTETATLASIFAPAEVATLVAVIGYDATRHSATTLHMVIDREDPIPTYGPARYRSGTLTMIATDFAAAASIMSLCARRGEPLLLRQARHPGLDMAFVPLSATIRPANEHAYRWSVDVEYAEIGYPTAPLTGAAGWVCSTVAAYGTCLLVKADFVTCADLLVGP